MHFRNRHLPALRVLAAAVLFALTSGFVLWQNAHLTVLWDLSYILENATRISLGQLPYRDFPFPYAPLTFLVQAAIIHLCGRSVLHHYIYAAIAAGVASLLTWRILARLLPPSRLPLAWILALPMAVLGTGSIFPHPFYDADCTLCVLALCWLLLRLDAADFPRTRTFLSGALLVLPPLIKQNTGLAFLASALVVVAWLGFYRRRAALLLAGATVGTVAALLAIQFTVGLGNYIHWTLTFAAARRLPALATIADIYANRELLWMYAAFGAGIVLFRLRSSHSQRSQWLRSRATAWIAAALLAAPFAWALAALWIYDDDSDRAEPLLHLWPVLTLAVLILALIRLPRARSIRGLLPFILLGTILGAFLSQQLWGSTYALWPLFMILLAWLLAWLTPKSPASAERTIEETRCPTSARFWQMWDRKPPTAPPVLDEASPASLAEFNIRPATLTAPLSACAVFAATALLIAGSGYALSHERLSYADLDGPTLEDSSLPALRGLAMRGSWLPDFEELVAYTERNIPRDDAILSIPGEDLFYFTTGRTPRVPVLMMDNTVNPYSAKELVEIAHKQNVRWLIVKRQLQLQEQPIAFRAQLLDALSRDYEPVEELNNYTIYRRTW